MPGMTDEKRPVFTVEQKAKWLAALRSGDYEQGTGCLRVGMTNRHCCLGVACEVVGPGLTLRPSLGVEPRDGSWGPAFWAPVSSSELTDTEDEGVLCEAVCMNDGGRTFLEIADYLERHLPAREEP